MTNFIAQKIVIPVAERFPLFDTIVVDTIVVLVVVTPLRAVVVMGVAVQ